MSEHFTSSGGFGAGGRVVLIPDEHILYDTPIIRRLPSSVPLAIAERWLANTLDAIESRFVPGWQAVLATLDDFLTKVADPATLGYGDFVNPAFYSRRGRSAALSITLHDKHLHAAYEAMKAAIDFLTGDGKDAYRLKLENSLDAYRQAEALPLSLTGEYLEALLGAAVRQWFFWSLSAKFPLFKWLTDYTEGGYPPATPFLTADSKWDQGRFLMDLLIQGGCFLLQQISVRGVHDHLDNWLSAYLSTDWAAPPDSFIRFLLVNGLVHIRSVVAFLE